MAIHCLNSFVSTHRNQLKPVSGHLKWIQWRRWRHTDFSNHVSIGFGLLDPSEAEKEDGGDFSAVVVVDDVVVVVVDLSNVSRRSFVFIATRRPSD